MSPDPVEDFLNVLEDSKFSTRLIVRFSSVSEIALPFAERSLDETIEAIDNLGYPGSMTATGDGISENGRLTCFPALNLIPCLEISFLVLGLIWQCWVELLRPLLQNPHLPPNFPTLLLLLDLCC